MVIAAVSEVRSNTRQYQNRREFLLGRIRVRVFRRICRRRIDKKKIPANDSNILHVKIDLFLMPVERETVPTDAAAVLRETCQK